MSLGLALLPVLDQSHELIAHELVETLVDPGDLVTAAAIAWRKMVDHQTPMVVSARLEVHDNLRHPEPQDGFRIFIGLQWCDRLLLNGGIDLGILDDADERIGRLLPELPVGLKGHSRPADGVAFVSTNRHGETTDPIFADLNHDRAMGRVVGPSARLRVSDRSARSIAVDEVSDTGRVIRDGSGPEHAVPAVGIGDRGFDEHRVGRVEAKIVGCGAGLLDAPGHECRRPWERGNVWRRGNTDVAAVKVDA